MDANTMIIYQIINKINNKKYIGLTKRTVEERWMEHLVDYKSKPNYSKLYNAFKKYGIKNFRIEQIDFAANLKELSEKEIFWIEQLNTVDEGYNILSGGIYFNSDNAADYWNGLSQEEKENYRKNMSQIQQGRKLRGQSSSRFMGVHQAISKIGGIAWTCCIKINKKRYRKNFDTEIEAAIAYDKLAQYFYEKRAKTNFNKKYSKEELINYLIEFKKPKKRKSVKKHFKYPHKYKHVNFIKSHNQWRAMVYDKTYKILFCFYHNNEDEAFKAQQKFLKKYNKKAE